jgi:SAM-dependent methyltransferase
MEAVTGGSDGTKRGGEYAVRGDYHRAPSPDWNYYPTYLAKMRLVRDTLDRLAPSTRVLDAGCGEGVLVDAYADGLAIEGLDANYGSDRVRRGSLLDLPYAQETFDRVLCLDVLEHLTFDHQARAAAELHRVLKTNGEAIVSVPNLAHLQSRVRFLVGGRLMRTSSPHKHPGDRPAGEYVALLERAGFTVVRRAGIFPTVPGVTHLIRRHPASLRWLHDALTRLLPVPGWCFLNVFWLRKAEPARRPAA